MKIFKLVNFELKKFLSLKKVILITLILILTCFGFIKFFEFNCNKNNIQNYFSTPIEELKPLLEKYKKDFEKERTAQNFYILLLLDDKISEMEMFNGEVITFGDWRSNVLDIIHSINNQEYFAKIYLEDVDMKDFALDKNYENKEEAQEDLNKLEEDKKPFLDIIKNGKYYDYVEMLLENEKESLKSIEGDIKLIEKNAVLPNYTAVSRLHNLISEKNVSMDKIKLYNYAIDNKIEDSSDWRYKVIQNIIFNLNNQHKILDNEEEFSYNKSSTSTYVTYENYLKQQQSLIDDATNKNNKNWYYLEHDIKPLTLDSNTFSMPYTTRLSMNNVYYMVIVSLIITIIMCGGIVANEHKTGSIRLLLTKPYKRWKVLLSKLLSVFTIFIVMCAISYIITYILSGIMYGFGDFTIPIVINQNKVITDVSYTLFTLKNMALSIVISLLFLSLSFSISSITFKTSVSISILLILIFVLSLLPLMLKFDAIFTYIPFVLINFYEAIFPHFNTGFSNINIDTSIIVSLIMMFVILFITFIIYCKRDIKN